MRSGTAVGAHYREARRARSGAEFVSTIQTGVQELDETLCWIELLAESGIVDSARLGPLRKEAEELLAILTSSAKTAKRSMKSRQG